jgi:hypothetical protein
MTAILEILASATFIWVVGISILIAMAILLENELEGWTTTLFSLGLALMVFNFKVEIWTFLTQNPTQTIIFSLSYVLIGIIWSFIKWQVYVKNIFGKLKEIKKDFIAEYGPITESNLERLNNRIKTARFKRADDNNYTVDISKNDSLEDVANKISPIASKKKSVITSWISYWPVSVAATLLNNPFRRFFEWVYDNISGYYDKITAANKKQLLND